MPLAALHQQPRATAFRASHTRGVFAAPQRATCLLSVPVWNRQDLPLSGVRKVPALSSPDYLLHLWSQVLGILDSK
jgi:hypothetical protein